MFEKRANKENSKNTFGDKNYKMKDKYNADELIVASLQRISSDCNDFGPMVETTDHKFIFELISQKNIIKYREIFTGFTTECVDSTSKDDFDFKYFDLPYVYNPQKFTKYIPEAEGRIIPKLSLIWAINDINHSKSKVVEVDFKNRKR